MQGQIIKIISDLHVVSCDGHTYPCKCRGIFRKEHITPLVGDYVLFSKEKNLIESIVPRKNEFQRPKVSNIDQAFLITSLVRPDFSTNLLDKLLVTMELHGVDAVIVITKEALVKESEKLQRQINVLFQGGTPDDIEGTLNTIFLPIETWNSFQEQYEKISNLALELEQRLLKVEPLKFTHSDDILYITGDPERCYQEGDTIYINQTVYTDTIKFE